MKEESFKNLEKEFFIKSCILTKEDLKKLFSLCKRKADEAKTFEIKHLNESPLQDKIKHEELLEHTSENFKMFVSVSGRKGEFIADTKKSIFEEENFPEDIKSISIDCILSFKAAYNLNPQNWFSITISFFAPAILDFSSPNGQSFKSMSNVRITGSNDTWVNAMYSEMKDFFESRKSNRGWLHARELYNLLVVFPILPLVFYYTHKIDLLFHISGQEKSTLTLIGIFLPIIFAIFYLFRIIFNYTKWVYPYIEYKSENNPRGKLHRKFLLTIFVAILGYTVSELLRIIF